MKQNRRQAAANARRTASDRVNSRRAGAGMVSATGQPSPFQRPAGEFISTSERSPQKKVALAVSHLIPFL